MKSVVCMIASLHRTNIAVKYTRSNAIQPFVIIQVKMSHPMGKPTICIGENKGADQLRGNREADQRHCFRYSDSTIPLLLKSEISSFWLFSVLVQVGLCRTCSETTLLVFPRGGSNIYGSCFMLLVCLFELMLNVLVSS